MIRRIEIIYFSYTQNKSISKLLYKKKEENNFEHVKRYIWGLGNIT